MNDPWMNRLSEYLDGELASQEAAELERHLAGCAECRETMGELSAVIRRAGTLPDREPGHDLWPEVEAGIHGRRGVPVAPLGLPRVRRRFSFTVPQFAAAAAVLMAATAGFTWWMSGPAGSTPAEPLAGVNRPGVSQTAVVRSVGAIAGSSYDGAIRELQAVLAQREESLDSSTVRIIRENLALIDRAIGQARAALATDPSNPYLTEHLSETMRRKLELLRRSADLSASTS